MALRKRLLLAGGLLLSVIVFSMAGYRILGGDSVGFLQALYMAVITLAGVQYIVCGLGDTGRHAVHELHKTGTPHVVIELVEENVKRAQELYPEIFANLLYVIGDATEEELLEKAGVERAKGIIATLPL